jgi:hypothetical protein
MSLSSSRLRTSSSNDTCTSTCQSSECYTSSVFVCQAAANGSVRQVSSQVCAASCEATSCRTDSAFVCRTMGASEVRTSSSNDVCLTNCPISRLSSNR